MKVLLVLSTVLAGAAGLGYSTSGDMEPGQSRKMTESSWVVCSKPSSRIAWDFVSLFDNLDFNVDHNMVSRDLVVYVERGRCCCCCCCSHCCCCWAALLLRPPRLHSCRRAATTPTLLLHR